MYKIYPNLQNIPHYLCFLHTKVKDIKNMKNCKIEKAIKIHEFSVWPSVKHRFLVFKAFLIQPINNLVEAD